MAFKISDITGALRYGGARPTLFQVELTSKFDGALNQVAPFMIQAATLPASTIGSIEVPYFGRKIRVAGDRTFEPWQVTIMNDEDFKVRHSMELWHNKINSLKDNAMGTTTSSPQSYKSDAIITQFSKKGGVIRKYKFYDLFPTDISSIDVDWNATDTIETFSVVFSYDWYEVIDGGAGNSTLA